MTYAELWREQIIVRWDGVIPPGVPDGAIHEPGDITMFWTHLTGHVRYSKKLDAYCMTLSLQNLDRLRRQFPAIPINNGYRIKELEQRAANFGAMVDLAEKIKTLPYDRLPKYGYKVDPLGEYQHRGTVLLSNVRRVPLFVDCGCLTGDTRIRYTRAKCSRTDTLATLYRNQETARPNRRTHVKTLVRSFKGDVIGLHPIQRVVERGMKEVWSLRLEDGKSLKGTPDHQILTSRGWVEIQHLTTNDSVMVDDLVKHQAKPNKRKPSRKGDERVAVGKYHPYARWQSSHGGTTGSYLVEIHRAIFEAQLNGLSYAEFIERTYSGQTLGLKFIDPSRYHIHHKDKNHYNNDPNNLEVLTKETHVKHHSRGYKNFGHGVPVYTRVSTVVRLGTEMTYDIVCEDPHRNFVANGIVVHNCGKTYMALTSTEHQIKVGLLRSGETLVCGKLITLQQGWIEDAAKFTNLKVINLWVPKKHKRKQRFLELLAEPADIYLINHDGLRVFKEELAAKRFKKIIVDESTILKSFHGRDPRIKGGQFGRALLDVAEHAEWRVCMTGTPAPNNLTDLWGQFHFLDPRGTLLEPSYNDYRTEVMDCVDLRGKASRNTAMQARDPKKWVQKPGAAEVVGARIGRIAYRVRIRDVIPELPERTVICRKVPMDPEQAKHYVDMDKRLRVEYQEKRITVQVLISKFTKLSQLASGWIIDESSSALALPVNPKVELLDSMLEDEIAPDKKVIVYATYRHEIEFLQNRYKDRGAVSGYGGNSSEINIENVRRFINDPSLQLLFLHPASMAHGITLTVAHYMVFFSYTHSAEFNYQSMARIERASQKFPMWFYYLMAQRTIDEDKYATIQFKTQNQAATIDQDQALVSAWLNRT